MDISKLMDFEPTATPDEMAQKTMDEVLHGDMRLMVGTREGVRSTILSLPTRLDRRVKHFDLAGKTIIFTGCGRGIGAMLSQKIAAQYHSKIIILDIIELQEKTPLWATMNDAELAAAGISPDLVRFSVGIEDVEDLIADIEGALANV